MLQTASYAFHRLVLAELDISSIDEASFPQAQSSFVTDPGEAVNVHESASNQFSGEATCTNDSWVVKPAISHGEHASSMDPG
jgi:hypothetical protein